MDFVAPQRPQPSRRTRRVFRCSSGGLILVTCLGVNVAASADDTAAPNEVPSAGAAQAKPDAPPDSYEQAVSVGMDEYDRGHYTEARAHFTRAHELAPSARTLRALGNVEFELRNYGDAVKLLHAALGSDVKPLEGALRLETENVLDRARVYVGEVHVDVEPGDAAVLVDGVTMARGPRASLDLLVGDHVLEFRAGGLMPERRVVHVKSGESTTIQVRLVPAGGTPLTSSFEIRALPAADAPHDRRVWLWVAGSIAAVALAVGLGVGLSQRKHETAEIPGGSTGFVLRSAP